MANQHQALVEIDRIIYFGTLCGDGGLSLTGKEAKRLKELLGGLEANSAPSVDVEQEAYRFWFSWWPKYLEKSRLDNPMRSSSPDAMEAIAGLAAFARHMHSQTKEK